MMRSRFRAQGLGLRSASLLRDHGLCSGFEFKFRKLGLRVNILRCNCLGFRFDNLKFGAPQDSKH